VSDLAIDHQRALNLWQPFARKFPAIGKATHFEADPNLDLARIGGLAEPKEEIQTYSCAATDPEVYQRWGTMAPSGLLLMGPPESGKTLLAEALATLTGTPFLKVRVPRLILQTLHTPGDAGSFLNAWTDVLEEMPQLTVFFREVDFKHAQSLIGRRPDLPVTPAMDFLLEFIDRTIAIDSAQVVGSTSHPRSLSPIFLEPGRFERVVWVQPVVPDDVADALALHAQAAEQRAGRPLFAGVNWIEVVKRDERASVGDWVRVMHGVLRRKARCDAADESPGGVSTHDFIAEVERFDRAPGALPASPGKYL
jgi:ATP-dependent 26S proteasome regulatory subunit